MRVPAWMIFGLLISLFIMDVASVWMVRGKIMRAADMALDAALVGGLRDYDAKTGKSFIDEDNGHNLALSYFKKNMNLDGNLENEVLKDTDFELQFEQDGVKPKVTVFIKTTIKAMCPKAVGLDGIPVNIKKTQYHISNYK